MRLRRFACVALLGGLMIPTNALAEKRSYDMTIEDTKINLVDNQDFHTFAFNGQVPAPLFHVMEGDEVTVNVTNLTSLPHTIHWHGLLQRSEEHTSELQSLMRISYAVFCLKKKKQHKTLAPLTHHQSYQQLK